MAASPGERQGFPTSHRFRGGSEPCCVCKSWAQPARKRERFARRLQVNLRLAAPRTSMDGRPAFAPKCLSAVLHRGAKLRRIANPKRKDVACESEGGIDT